MEYIVKTENDNKAVSEIIKGWGSDILVSRGKPHKAQDLDGILVYENGKIIGLGLYLSKIIYRGKLLALYNDDLKTVSVVTQEDDKE